MIASADLRRLAPALYVGEWEINARSSPPPAPPLIVSKLPSEETGEAPAPDERPAAPPNKHPQPPQDYHRVGEDGEGLARLAAYYNVPLEKLECHREWYRKALSACL